MGRFHRLAWAMNQSTISKGCRVRLTRLALVLAVSYGLFEATRPGIIAGPALTQRPAYLGVEVRRPAEDLIAHLSPPAGAGLLVVKVEPNSPAAKAGIEPYDLLIRLNDQLLFHPQQLSALINSFEPGQKVTIELIHQAKARTVSVVLEEHQKEGHEEKTKPPVPPCPSAVPFQFNPPPAILPPWWDDRALEQFEKGWRRWWKEFNEKFQPRVPPCPPFEIPPNSRSWRLGIVVVNPDPALLAQLSHLHVDGGALVIFVLPGSPAELAGLRAYDLIVAVNDEPVKSASQLTKLISRQSPGARITLKVIRCAKEEKIIVSLDSQQGSVQRKDQPKSPPIHDTNKPEQSDKAKPDTQITVSSQTVVLSSPAGLVVYVIQGDKRHLTVTAPSGQVMYQGDPKIDPGWKDLPDELRLLVEKAFEQLHSKGQITTASPQSQLGQTCRRMISA